MTDNAALAAAALVWYHHNGISSGPIFFQQAPLDQTLSRLAVQEQQNRAGDGLAQAPQSFKKDASSQKLARSKPAHVGPDRKGAPYDFSELFGLGQQEALVRLRQMMQGYQGCTLAQSAQNLVFSDGNPGAEIVLVGEAPGAEEDLQGKPFVGPSGQLLDAVLASIGLDRQRVYITNVVPYRPPFNRQPTATEIACWMPFLRQHLAILAPRVLVCVGSVAYKALLAASDPIGKAQEKTWQYRLALPTPQALGARRPALEQPEPQTDKQEPGRDDGLSHNLLEGGTLQESPIPTFVMFHPAYLLRSPAQKRSVWAVMRRLRTFLESIG
jgi:uracil-DNA glycosylase